MTDETPLPQHSPRPGATRAVRGDRAPRQLVERLVDELEGADTRYREKVVGRRMVHIGRYMNFEVDRVERGDGSLTERDICDHPGAVAILAVDDQDRLLLVCQYRLPTGRALLEIPAGTLDRNDEEVEDPDLAAARELEEETGYRADRLERLAGFWTAPGFATEYMTLYLATGLRPAGADRLRPDEDERLHLFRLPWQDALAAVHAGLIEDAKSILGILWLARRMAVPR